jgi:hypothetical protein
MSVEPRLLQRWEINFSCLNYGPDDKGTIAADQFTAIFRKCVVLFGGKAAL